jgi:hypothetical protein
MEDEFCCKAMRVRVEKCRQHDPKKDERCSIWYDPQLRDYTIPLDGSSMDPIWYCPWCGKKLPESLDREWEDVIAKELGEEYVGYPIKVDELPPEFHTDEWWKKRGL